MMRMFYVLFIVIVQSVLLMCSSLCAQENDLDILKLSNLAGLVGQEYVNAREETLNNRERWCQSPW